MTENAIMTKKMTYESNGKEVTLTGNMIQDFVAKGNAKVNEQEIVMFMNLCKFNNLNPFLNEAYLVKFNGSPAQIITSKEAFMKRANADRHYKGFKAGIIVQRGKELKEIEGTIKLPDDKLIGGWCSVERDDFSEPVYVSVSVDEFGKSQATWKSMPANMIRKTAIVNALREAFPEQLGAMYTEDDKQPTETNTEPKEVVATETDNTIVNEMLNEVQQEVEGDKDNELEPEGQSETVETSEQSIFEEAPTETE